MTSNSPPYLTDNRKFQTEWEGGKVIRGKGKTRGKVLRLRRGEKSKK
jgi:hypothetical protein